MEPKATSCDPLDALVDRLRAYLSRPLQLEGDAAGFVASTFGDAEADTLRELFADTDSSEAETLLELLLFPDTPFQVSIEPLLSELDPPEATLRTLVQRLGAPPIDLTIGVATSADSFRIPLPDDLLERFIARLNVTRRLPPELDAALAESLPETACLHARVRLRNGATAMGRGAAGFCAAFLRHLSSEHRDFWAAMDLLIRLAPELDAGEDPFDLLTDRKQGAFQMVEQQREFEHRLQRSNIETLLGQGQRVPTLARAEARRQMRLVDAICLAVYGRTTYFEAARFD